MHTTRSDELKGLGLSAIATAIGGVLATGLLAVAPVDSAAAQSAPPACVAWAEGGTYTAGEVVTYNGATYTAIVAQTDYAGTGWNPASTPSLWQAGGTCSGGLRRRLHHHRRHRRPHRRLHRRLHRLHRHPHRRRARVPQRGTPVRRTPQDPSSAKAGSTTSPTGGIKGTIPRPTAVPPARVNPGPARAVARLHRRHRPLHRRRRAYRPAPAPTCCSARTRTPRSGSTGIRTC